MMTIRVIWKCALLSIHLKVVEYCMLTLLKLKLKEKEKKKGWDVCPSWLHILFSTQELRLKQFLPFHGQHRP